MESAFVERIIMKMKKISRQEVLTIAQMSRIALRDNEVDVMVEQLDQVLSYAERVGGFATELCAPSTK